MAEPRIQYAQTEDGVSIAYFVSGQGTPYVSLNDIPFSHVQLERRYMPSSHEVIERWGKLIRLDPRGMGMSDREVDRFTLDDWVLDVEAVVNRLGLDQFILGGTGFSGVVAIAYAVRHPDKVSRLVLLNAVARPADAFATPQSGSLAQMLVSDWEMFSENVGALAFGWGREDARVYGEFIRAAATQAGARRVFAALAAIDVTDLLPSITAPTLVLHHSAIKYAPLELAKRLVSRIPDGRLVVIEGANSFEPEAISEPMLEFLNEGGDVGPDARAEAGAFRTILFTDIVGSTALTQRLGDVKSREILREHERMVREALSAHGGSEVKTMGDGFMASFSSATKALECAIAMQKAFAERNETSPESIKVRMGLNAGEPIAEEADLFGTAVNRAARIAAMAEGGEILVANVVRELAEGKDFMFGDRGATALRGFDDPVRLFEVRWRE
jgi:class 3 adenylate cyclase/pimeloyl-ACP methyl ester carboxylesterase